ncbi:methyltransferase N6AMT1 [Rhopalosiphum maidis]|uniref:methyltransferase N6AMT1 n=1 Tax=Rhopalosiphum maidis TaxID=43146 RepID=UPI000EFF506D|nr:methyltransferase N6AMT1 [Rhopalosiphum maidis]
MIINTPVYSILENVSLDENNEEFTTAPSVYEPAEDTFLMLDVLELDLEQVINTRLSKNNTVVGSTTKCGPLLVVELGSGFGILTAAISMALNNTLSSIAVGSHCIAVDMNPIACRKTVMTCKHNDVEVDAIRGDLLTWMRQPEKTNANNDSNKEVYGPIDILLFNPPYVRGPEGEQAPTPRIAKIDTKDQVAHDRQLAIMADAAWLGGGPDGVDVLKRALHQAADLLSEFGVFYALMIDYNYNALVRDEMQARRDRADQNIYYDDLNNIELTTFGSTPASRPLICTRILSRNVPGERLAVYRIYRPIDFN